MKIVFTSYLYLKEFSDPEAWLQRIAPVTGIMDALAKNADVLSIERINYEGELVKNNVRYRFLKFSKAFIRFPKRIHQIIKAENPDIVCVNGMIFPLQLIQLRKAIGPKPKIIVLHRAEKPSRGIKAFLQKIADKSVDAYLFSSAGLADTWLEKKQIAAASKVHEVMQASSCFTISDKYTAKEITKVKGDPVYLWVGRLENNKDPLTVIRAFLAFLRDSADAKLYMIFQEDKLLPEVQTLILSVPYGASAIRLVGKIPYAELGNWYNSADFIISGSHYEGSGVAVCEAMSCGCIPLLTDIFSFRKMTGPGICGLLYKAGDHRDLLNKLRASAAMDIQREKIKTLTQFKQELSFEAIAGKIMQVAGSLRK
ncbi:MAG: glycosyltransferase family 4 protein [Chitinophagaceae bacterium]|nr:glycosyltransferase family 4 protein [Chitinophagaceae bacterium]